MNARERSLVPYYDKTLKYYSPICDDSLARFRIKWPGTVLDLGCGDGRLAEFVPAGVDIIGIDASAGRIAQAQARWPAFSWQVGDLYDALPSPAGGWELICLFEVLEHLAKPLLVLTAAIDALKPNGRVIGSVPIAGGLSERHLQCYSTPQNAVERLLESAWSERFGRHLLMEWRSTP